VAPARPSIGSSSGLCTADVTTSWVKRIVCTPIAGEAVCQCGSTMSRCRSCRSPLCLHCARARLPCTAPG
jgi:hypothetical protein